VCLGAGLDATVLVTTSVPRGLWLPATPWQNLMSDKSGDSHIQPIRSATILRSERFPRTPPLRPFVPAPVCSCAYLMSGKSFIWQLQQSCTSSSASFYVPELFFSCLSGKNVLFMNVNGNANGTAISS